MICDGIPIDLQNKRVLRGFSNSVERRREHPENQKGSETRTDSGIMTDFTPDHKKVDFSMCSKHEPLVNSTDSQPAQTDKLDSARILTDAGITIWFKALSQNADSSIISSSEPSSNRIFYFARICSVDGE
jgi:hypothetical protein